jgi:carbamoyltransferase
MGTEIEMLSIGNCILRKEEQNPALARDYKDAFEPD